MSCGSSNKADKEFRAAREEVAAPAAAAGVDPPTGIADTAGFFAAAAEADTGTEADDAVAAAPGAAAPAAATGASASLLVTASAPASAAPPAPDSAAAAFDAAAGAGAGAGTGVPGATSAGAKVWCGKKWEWPWLRLGEECTPHCALSRARPSSPFS